MAARDSEASLNRSLFSQIFSFINKNWGKKKKPRFGFVGQGLFIMKYLMLTACISILFILELKVADPFIVEKVIEYG